MFPFLIARASILAFVSTASPRTFASTSTNMLEAAEAALAAVTPGSPTTRYILRYNYVPDVLELRGPHREQHLRLAKELCLSGGPTAPLQGVVPTGALFIFADTDSAKQTLGI